MRRLILETDIGAILNNARAVRERIPENVRMACVVKADAYGHGAIWVAQALAEEKLADAFAVATPSEGAALRNNGITLPIVVLGLPGDKEGAETSVNHNLSQAVASAEDVRLLAEAARICDCKAKAHIKIDTGMSRIGIRYAQELDGVLDAFTECPNVVPEGMFTHFCAADTDEEFTLLQKKRFDEARSRVFARGFRPICHAAASTAMLREGFGYDMVRAGIALYGTGVKELEGIVAPAQRLISHPVAFRTIEKGDSVGYGRKFIAERRTVVMTVPCGYGDGYPRLLSGKAQILVNGRRANIIGNVCMDMLMADVTDIPNVTVDTPVVLMGRDGEECITPDELARLASTIPYEIMLGFMNRVERIRV